LRRASLAAFNRRRRSLPGRRRKGHMRTLLASGVRQRHSEYSLPPEQASNTRQVGKGGVMAAPDFYFAINATFRWIHDNWGEEGLRAYWRAMGREHFAPVTERFRAGGLEAVQEYWRDFFAEEPGGDVSVDLQPDCVRLEVRICPAIKHLRDHGREIMPLYCDHCTVVSQAMCEGADLTVRVEGGMGSCSMGSCTQVFTRGE